MSLRLRIHPASALVPFERDHLVRIGRGRHNDVRVGHERVGGIWSVSGSHAEIRWDGNRWSTVNVSDKLGLLKVYEPGYEETVLEPGRPWVPVRHRWALAFGRPGARTHVACTTDDHRGPAVMTIGPALTEEDDLDGAEAVDEPTVGLDGAVVLPLTELERDVLFAYYGAFAQLPRPATLEPRSHDEAARRLGRSRDSTRKAVERVNEKIGRVHDAPEIATGRNVSSEIGRWLARSGVLDLD